ncbi:venom peptide isomerase heavy chain-like [Uloborus diversus]|uniref:venom peptide isomerase heavy chain-like n=1 Tax=Uloborus diversus TaxID=327109 RepID=UPI0024092925|nr:venom peptide isomerase heavy chain-like [Uloborus diversus]
MFGTLYVFVLLCAAQFVVGEQIQKLYDPLTGPNCGKSLFLPEDKDRIVGGGYVKHGMYPWMVSLYEKQGSSPFKHVCGATVLNDRWIVTAAHCIDYKTAPWRYEAYIGLHKLSETTHPIVRRLKISHIYVHEDHNKYTHTNDIALLKTADPIDISSSDGYINGICLPKGNEDPEGQGVVTGWGHERSWGYNSDILKHVTIPLVNRAVCDRAYGGSIREMMICAGSTNKDTCQNDSGGPLFQVNSDGIATLVGITSFGRGCGLEGYPGVYTKVSHFRDWMATTMSS